MVHFISFYPPKTWGIWTHFMEMFRNCHLYTTSGPYQSAQTAMAVMHGYVSQMHDAAFHRACLINIYLHFFPFACFNLVISALIFCKNFCLLYTHTSSKNIYPLDLTVYKSSVLTKYCIDFLLLTLSQKKNLESSKLKYIADDSYEFDKNVANSRKGKKTLREKKKLLLSLREKKQFLLSLKCFQRTCTADT